MTSDLERAGSASLVIQPAGPIPSGYTDADFTVSTETVQRIIDAPPDNTERAYDRNWDQFTRWCAR